MSSPWGAVATQPVAAMSLADVMSEELVTQMKTRDEHAEAAAVREREEAAAAVVAAAAAAEAAAVAAAQVWACPICTLENPGTSMACEACGTERPLVSGDAAGAAAPAAAPAVVDGGEVDGGAAGGEAGEDEGEDEDAKLARLLMQQEMDAQAARMMEYEQRVSAAQRQ